MYSTAKDSILGIWVFDVGHGDSILVEFPDGKSIGIIDCHTHQASHRGCNCETWDESEPKVLTYLRKRLDDEGLRVAFACITHFHLDHYLGYHRLLELLDEKGIPIEELWDPGKSVRKFTAHHLKANRFTTKAQQKALGELVRFYRIVERYKKKNMKMSALVKPQESICTIADVAVDILAPNGWHWDAYNDFLRCDDPRSASSANRTCTDEHLVCSAMMIRFAGIRILLGADLTSCAWNEVVKAKKDGIRAHVVKASHHGSKEGNFLLEQDSSATSLWQYLQMKDSTIAVISGGYRDKLPHVDTLAELGARSIDIYCTGDYSKYLGDDVSQDACLSIDAATLLANTTQCIMKGDDSYHGDIKIEVDGSGKIRVRTEHDLPAIAMT